MRIVWTDHAKDSLRLRPGSGQFRVEGAILEPDQAFPSGDADDPPGRTVAHKLIELQGKTYLLRVFYDLRSDGTAEVVSFYRTHPERYWRADL